MRISNKRELSIKLIKKIIYIFFILILYNHLLLLLKNFEIEKNIVSKDKLV